MERRGDECWNDSGNRRWTEEWEHEQERWGADCWWKDVSMNIQTLKTYRHHLYLDTLFKWPQETFFDIWLFNVSDQQIAAQSCFWFGWCPLKSCKHATLNKILVPVPSPVSCVTDHKSLNYFKFIHSFLIYSGLQKYSYPLNFSTFCHVTATNINRFYWNFMWKTNTKWHTIVKYKENYTWSHFFLQIKNLKVWCAKVFSSLFSECNQLPSEVAWWLLNDLMTK